MMEPVLVVWWFRPVLSALRVGEHSAVVWKLLKRRPSCASWSMVGVRIGPPNVLGPPKPMSSISTITTLGAPLGALTSNRAGGFAFRASRSLYVGRGGSWIGRTVRSGISCAKAPAAGNAPTRTTYVPSNVHLDFSEPDFVFMAFSYPTN